MTNNNIISTLFLLLFIIITGALLILASGCGKGVTETGSTDPTEPLVLSKVSARIENLSDALVPDVNGDAVASLSSKAITYESSDDWSVYLEDDNLFVLTDIFGPAGDDAPVTRIRVLVDQFASQVETIFSSDTEGNCGGGSSTLADADTIDIAFYGELTNGSEGDRNFDCVLPFDGGEDDQAATVYGIDSDNVLRFAYMRDVTSANTEETDTRGNFARGMSVTLATYSETEESSTTYGNIDIRYNQASIYSGPDDVFGTDDDIFFKSRSRITGQGVVADSNAVTLAVGDFNVIKYDLDSWEQTTKTIGRGSYEVGGYSIFNIDSDVTNVADKAGFYCIEGEADGIPAYADSTNCESYEDAVPWSTTAFPFTPTPAIESVFEDKSFFEANDTDLIEDDGGNFTIPTYVTS